MKGKHAARQMDLLSGTILDKLILFALPLALSSALQQLFNSVDVAVVGKFSSSEAQAAVGLNGPVINLLLNLFIGISVGTNVVIARYIGQKQKSRITDAVHTSMTVAIMSGLFLLVIGILISKPLLILMDTPENVLPKAILYLRIYFLGMPFIMIYNFGASILRSMGDTKRPLYCLLISGIVNAGLNLVLVLVFRLDVAGVAIATVVSNIISAGMVLAFLVREEEPFRLFVSRFGIKKAELLKVLRIGVPAGLQATVFSIANVFIQATLNRYGADAVAGSAVALNFEYFAYFIVGAFNQTTVTFTSQNYGAGNYERCKKIFRLSMLTSMAVCVCMSLTFVLGRSFFISLFTSKEVVAHYASIRMVHLLCPYVLICSYEIAGSALRGMGYSMTPAVLTVFGTCVFRLVWIYTVCRGSKDFALLMNVYPASWVLTGAAVLIAYYTIRKKALDSRRL